MNEWVKIDVSAWGVGTELTFANVAQLANIEIDLPDKDTVVIDLKSITHTDSAGLALLVEWMKQAHINGHKLRYSGIPEQLARLICVAGLEFMVADLDV